MDLLLLSIFVSCIFFRIPESSTFPTKLGERARYAPVLRRIAFSRIFPVDFEVRLSSIVAVEFLLSDILSFGLVMAEQLLFRVFMFSRPFIRVCTVPYI